MILTVLKDKSYYGMYKWQTLTCNSIKICLALQIGHCSNIDKKSGRKQKIKNWKKKKKTEKAEAIEYEMNLSGQSSWTELLYDSEENDNLLDEEHCQQPEIH